MQLKFSPQIIFFNNNGDNRDLLELFSPPHHHFGYSALGIHSWIVKEASGIPLGLI